MENLTPPFPINMVFQLPVRGCCSEVWSQKTETIFRGFFCTVTLTAALIQCEQKQLLCGNFLEIWDDILTNSMQKMSLDYLKHDVTNTNNKAADTKSMHGIIYIWGIFILQLGAKFYVLL